jgi:hypothetical protein
VSSATLGIRANDLRICGGHHEKNSPQKRREREKIWTPISRSGVLAAIQGRVDGGRLCGHTYHGGGRLLSNIPESGKIPAWRWTGVPSAARVFGGG